MAIRGVGSGGPAGGGGVPEQITHTVQKAETLDGIAQQHGVSKKDLIKENPQLEGAATLKAGMQLNIPAARGGATPTKAPAIDTFESRARRTFMDPVMVSVELPKFGADKNAKNVPVTLTDEAAHTKGESTAENNRITDSKTKKTKE